ARMLGEDSISSDAAATHGSAAFDESASDSKYIVLEKTEENARTSAGTPKREPIHFGNAIANKAKPGRPGAVRNLENSMPFHFQESKLAKKGPQARDIHVNKFPGSLYIAVDSVNGCSDLASKIAGLSVKLEVTGNLARKEAAKASSPVTLAQAMPANVGAESSPGKKHSTKEKKAAVGTAVFESPICQEGRSIAVDFYNKLSLGSDGPLRIKATLVQHKAPTMFFAGSSAPVAECNFEMESVDALQNKLFEMSGKWAPIRPLGIFKNVQRLFYEPNAPTGSINIYASYIADDELHTINAPAPDTFAQLYKWLTIRQHVNNLLFAGYLTVRYAAASAGLEGASQYEKKMYVKWYGFTIHLYDAFVKKFVSSIDIASAEVSLEFLSQGVVLFKLREGVVQLYCDTTEKLSGCMEALNTLFPRPVGTNKV
ncbi:hypothetical protein PAPHI01_1852, partial [Pancytospora philotis]